MQYQVYLQNLANKGFSATVLGIPDCRVEGGTREEVLAKVKEAVELRLAQGELVTIDVEPSPAKSANPWMKYYGSFRDDPTFDDFLAEIDAYRREIDARESE